MGHKVPVELPHDASFKDLRKLLGRWMEVPPDNVSGSYPRLHSINPLIASS